MKKPTVTLGEVIVVTLGQVEAKIYRVKNGDRSVYTISWSTGGGRSRRTRSDETEAIEEAKRIVTDIAAGRASVTKLPLEKIEYFQSQVSRLGEIPLHVAIDFYLTHAANAHDRSLGEVVDEFMAVTERRAEQKSSTGRWANTLRSRLSQFRGHFPLNTKFSGVSVRDLETFVYGKDWSEGTRFNMAATIKGLYRFAQRRGYVAPGLTTADRMEEIAKPKRTPKVFLPSEIEKILTTAEERFPELVAYTAIGAFAGVRAAEITRLRWEEHFNFDENLIVLPCEITKTSRRRVVEMNSTLKAWLLAYRKESGPVCPANPYTVLPKLAEAAEVDWPHNALRHSFVSYELARTQNAAKVAHNCGHSVTVLQTVYKQLVTPRQAVEWFKILPKKLAVSATI